ncbi:MAG TPA: hypothetical protein VL181_10245, partial [Holophagaceae bacterium]|nr:hypothetical protein [Holophagaceae bacterium]
KAAPLPAPKAAQPAIEGDPLVPLRPRLADAFTKVRTAAGPLGLLGWPGVVAPDGSDESDPALERRFFHNDRALVFVDKTTDRYSALVLMPESKSTDELHYWLVWVRDLFGSPKLERGSAESYGAADCLQWRGSETIFRDQYPSESEAHLYPDEAFRLLIGPRESDDTTLFLANATPRLQTWVQELTDGQGNLEGEHDPGEAEFAQTLKRSEFQNAIKQGESKRFIWFEVAGKPFAAEKASWHLWMKGARPSVIKDFAP